MQQTYRAAIVTMYHNYRAAIATLPSQLLYWQLTVPKRSALHDPLNVVTCDVIASYCSILPSTAGFITHTAAYPHRHDFRSFYSVLLFEIIKRNKASSYAGRVAIRR